VRLAAGAEPGRLIEDQDGLVHVALRRGGQVVRLDPRSGAVVSQRAVCPAPRGMAYEAATDNLHVACAGGELLTMKARGGDILRRLQLERDLRDVAIQGDHLLISRFRSAQLLEVDASGALVGQVKPRAVFASGLLDPQGHTITASATTAWRLAALPGGEVLMLHQQAVDTMISTKPGGYSAGTCKAQGIVSPALTLVRGAAAGAASVGNGARLAALPLAVDLAVARHGQSLALIAPGGQATPIGSPVGLLSLIDRTGAQIGRAERQRKLGGRIGRAVIPAAQLSQQTDFPLDVLDLRLEPGLLGGGGTEGDDVLGRLLLVLVGTNAILEFANPILEPRIPVEGLLRVVGYRSVPGRPAGQVRPDRIVVAFERDVGPAQIEIGEE
jgi:hypothetical protein